MQRPQSPTARPRQRSIAVGLILALVVLAAGVSFAVTQQKSFTAEAVLVVLPRANLDDATSAAFYETMSRGQIVGTFAEVANNPSFQSQAEDRLHLDRQSLKHLSTAVSVVPDTSVILVRVTADSASVAEQVADSTATSATSYLAQLSRAYRTQVVHRAAGSATSSGRSPALLAVLSAVVALTLGVAAQQVVYHLSTARHLISADESNEAPVGGSYRAPVDQLTAGRV